jgi:putative oxidoreductase
MSSVQSSPTRGHDRAVAFDADLAFLRRFASPIVLLSRVMMATIFVADGFGQVTSYADVAIYMGEHGVVSALLPLVVLTEIGGGLLVLVGFKTRWASLALAGFCLLTAVIFHLASGETIEFQKNLAMAGGFLLLAVLGPGAWSIDGRLGRAD